MRQPQHCRCACRRCCCMFFFKQNILPFVGRDDEVLRKRGSCKASGGGGGSARRVRAARLGQRGEFRLQRSSLHHPRQANHHSQPACQTRAAVVTELPSGHAVQCSAGAVGSWHAGSQPLCETAKRRAAPSGT
jgi:hypothetical protein